MPTTWQPEQMLFAGWNTGDSLHFKHRPIYTFPARENQSSLPRQVGRLLLGPRNVPFMFMSGNGATLTRGIAVSIWCLVR